MLIRLTWPHQNVALTRNHMGIVSHVEMVMGTVVDTMVVVAVVAIRGAIVTKVNGRVEVHMGVHVVECVGTNCPNSTTTRTKAQLQWF